MKIATLPSLRVEPALRDAAEVVGELRGMLGEAKATARRRKTA